MSIDYSCQKIHGIDKEWLLDAPKIEEVQVYICSHFGNSVFVGHGVVADLKVLNLPIAVKYTDTQWFEEFELPENHLGVRGNKKKLKDMVSAHLGAQIQDGSHSSVSAPAHLKVAGG